MHKKILNLTLIIMAFCALTLEGFCSFDSVLNTINSTIYTVDRVQSTGNYIKRTATPKNYNSKPAQQYSNYQQQYPQYNNYQQQNTQYYNQQPQYYQQNQYASPYSYTTNQTYTNNPTTVKDLPPGSIVIDPTSLWKYSYNEYYSGNFIIESPVFWTVFANNHFKQDSTLLVAFASVANYPFCHKNKGIRSWQDSDIRRFLRTTFYKHFSSNFQKAIVNVQTESADLNGKPYKIEDNVFLLSIVEWNLSDRKNNGKAVNYEFINRDYKAYEVSTYQNRLILKKENVENTWTRTINRPKATSAGYNSDVFTIKNGQGILETQSSYYSTYTRVRPAVNIKSSTRIKGPFTMNNTLEVTKPLTYYVLDFPATQATTK